MHLVLNNYGLRFTTLYRRQRSKPAQKKTNAKRQNGYLRRPYKQLRKEENLKAKEKEIYTQLNAEFQRIARRDKGAFLSDQCKEIEENNRIGKMRDLFKKIRNTKGIFHVKMATIKDRNGMDLTEAEDTRKRQEHTEELCKKVLMTHITMLMWSLTQRQTSLSVKSNGP